MYRSVLVPLDGSPFGEQALPLALAIARRARARLQLVHVHDPRVDRLQTFSTLGPRVPEGERAYLAALAGRLAAGPGVAVDWALLGVPIAEALRERAAASGAGLIVMTTHGRGPLSRFWLGSVADELIRHTPLPLMLVRPQERARADAPEPVLRRILIPLDGSDLAEQILGPALELARLMGAECRLVHPRPAVCPGLGRVRPGPRVGLGGARF